MTHDKLFTFIRSPSHWSKHFFYNLCNIIKSLFIVVPRNSRFDIWTCLSYTCMWFWWSYISPSLIATLLTARRMKGIICIENRLSEDNVYDEGGCRSARNTDPAQKRERMFRWVTDRQTDNAIDRRTGRLTDRGTRSNRKHHAFSLDTFQITFIIHHTLGHSLPQVSPRALIHLFHLYFSRDRICLYKEKALRSFRIPLLPALSTCIK